VPVSTRNCGLAGSEVEMMMVPIRGPSGLKITSIAQFPPEGKLDGHVLVSAKSMPEALMSRTVTAELLMLVSVAVLSGLAVPTGCGSNSSFGGVSLTTLEALAFNTRKTQSITIRHEFTLSPWPSA
jgi:hypothetical protein